MPPTVALKDNLISHVTNPTSASVCNVTSGNKLKFKIQINEQHSSPGREMAPTSVVLSKMLGMQLELSGSGDPTIRNRLLRSSSTTGYLPRYEIDTLYYQQYKLQLRQV